MTLLESRTLPLPLPKDFRHAQHPDNEVWPAHWNDVRFNMRPERQDRRCFIHDNYMNAYDISHDFAHTTGYVDEDMDFELPDPGVAMHFKLKRSQVTSFAGAFILIAALIGYPIFGLKIPQKDNPFYYRKKYATSTTIGQMQKIAHMEYGAGIPKPPCDSSGVITKAGFSHAGQGMRYSLDSYEDLVC